MLNLNSIENFIFLEKLLSEQWVPQILFKSSRVMNWKRWKKKTEKSQPKICKIFFFLPLSQCEKNPESWSRGRWCLISFFNYIDETSFPFELMKLKLKLKPNRLLDLFWWTESRVKFHFETILFEIFFFFEWLAN